MAIKKYNLKDRFELKEIYKETMSLSLNNAQLEYKLALADLRSLKDVRAAKWYATNYLPFTKMVYNTIYLIIGRKLKMPENHKTTFYKRLSMGNDLFNKLISHHREDIIAQQMCSNFRWICKKTKDPLQFIENVQNNCGTPFKAPNENEVADQLKALLARDSKVPPYKCRYCKIKKCNINSHKRYWANRNSKKRS